MQISMQTDKKSSILFLVIEGARVWIEPDMRGGEWLLDFSNSFYP